MPDGCPLPTVIGVEADNAVDAKAFVELSHVFGRHGVAVPEVYAHSDDYMFYIEEDLGDTSLFSLLGSDCADNLVAKALDELVRLQTVPHYEWRSCLAYNAFCRRQIFWDLNYFKYAYLKNCNVRYDENALEDDFGRFAAKLLSLPESCWGFMMRDCQSRNVMVRDGVPYFIDFQGGRYGPCIYDAVSFLWQAKAGFDASYRSRMMEHYIGSFAGVAGLDPAPLLDAVPAYALFRTLQVLGAYGFRGLVQKRAHFIESIPGALSNLNVLVDGGVAHDLPELRRICKELAEDGRFGVKADGRLHVKVFSFSYKRGYPDDFSGNGGGFMFDCRAMHNPGRYDQYKSLTGLDKPVIGFLKEKGEIDVFVDKAVDLVAPAVARYLKRGFSSLQIGFGCTGGRHRSVYSAQAVAERLAAMFPDAVVELCHREQNISHSFNVN